MDYTWPGWASPWLWTADTWAGMQFVVLVVGLVFAWRQLGEAAQVREDSSRPFVSIDMYVEDKIIYLSITNLGATMARDVHFTFEPPLRSSMVQDQVTSSKMLGTEGIPTLPPRKVITTVFDVFPHRESEGGYEDSYEVQATYRGERRKKYTDRITLDLGIYRDRVTVTRHGVHDVHEVLTRIHQVMAGWTDLLSNIAQRQ